MVLASQLTSGMTIIVNKEPYRVESAVKVAAQKANPFIKTKLRHLVKRDVVEKNFKPTQELEEIALEDHTLEYLYQDGKEHVFLNVGTLDVVKVPRDIIGNKVHYLKEGVEVKGACFGKSILSIDLPQFLELMVSSVEMEEHERQEGGTRVAILETGARLEVPPFVDVGDVIKVDTRLEEYIQRV
jgi:elongation factor P